MLTWTPIGFGLVGLAVLGVSVAACGGNGDSQATPSSTAEASPSGTRTPTSLQRTATQQALIGIPTGIRATATQPVKVTTPPAFKDLPDQCRVIVAGPRPASMNWDGAKPCSDRYAFTVQQARDIYVVRGDQDFFAAERALR
jgi:hypothetical protein